MNPNWLTDAQVEQEIERLTKSPLVQMARQEARIRNKRRQYLYQLRNLEKKGLAMAQEGLSLAMLEDAPAVETVYDKYLRLTFDNKKNVATVIDALMKAQEVTA